MTEKGKAIYSHLLYFCYILMFKKRIVCFNTSVQLSIQNVGAFAEKRFDLVQCISSLSLESNFLKMFVNLEMQLHHAQVLGTLQS